MRFWDWGQADSEFSDWWGEQGTFRTPFGPWGSTAEMSEANTQRHQSDHNFGKVGDSVWEFLIEIALAQIKAKLGQVPILLAADLVLTSQQFAAAGSGTALMRRMLRVWDTGDASNWEYDVSASLSWYLDKHHIVRGQDVEETPSDTSNWAHSVAWDISRISMKNVVERALRDNTPIRAHLSEFHNPNALPTSMLGFIWNITTVKSRRPYLSFAYLYPIESYHDDGSGNLDLSSPVTDNPGDEYYLGAVEPGQTGTPVKNHIRNYSGAVQQVEILDDHAEYTTPISRIGSSQLDYINLAEAAVSQKYTAVFYSATQFEVKAVAFRDNAISLHPAINADASWRGAVGSDFAAPSGGLTIPSAAWQPGTALNDEYEVGVRGNTTDTSWPADSNDQVQMTKDNAGSADAAAWRGVVAHRELTTAQVTVDATSKFFPTRKVNPTEWPIDTKAFVMDATNINEGEISSVQEADIGTLVFSGSGLDDATFSGNYNGVWTDDLRVEIDATGTPDTFRWSIDGGSTWEATGVAITGAAQLLQDGLYVTFAATTGHTINDYWEAPIESWGITLKSLTANSNIYNSNTRIATTLPIRDVPVSVFSAVDQASGVSQGSPARLWLGSTVGFSVGQDVFIQNPLDPLTAETKEIDAIQAGEYLDLTTALVEDYNPGNLCTVVGSGQAAYWTRPVATAVTVEELKRLRLVARIL